MAIPRTIPFELTEQWQDDALEWARVQPGNHVSTDDEGNPVYAVDGDAYAKHIAAMAVLSYHGQKRRTDIVAALEADEG